MPVQTSLKKNWRQLVYKFLLVNTGPSMCRDPHAYLMSLSIPLQRYPAYLLRIIWMVYKIGDKWPYCRCFVECYFQDVSRKTVVSFCSFPQVFFPPSVSLTSRWCIYWVLRTQPQLGRNPVLFYQRDQIFIWLITY